MGRRGLWAPRPLGHPRKGPKAETAHGVLRRQGLRGVSGFWSFSLLRNLTVSGRPEGAQGPLVPAGAARRPLRSGPGALGWAQCCGGRSCCSGPWGWEPSSKQGLQQGRPWGALGSVWVAPSSPLPRPLLGAGDSGLCVRKGPALLVLRAQDGQERAQARGGGQRRMPGQPRRGHSGSGGPAVCSAAGATPALVVVRCCPLPPHHAHCWRGRAGTHGCEGQGPGRDQQ